MCLFQPFNGQQIHTLVLSFLNLSATSCFPLYFQLQSNNDSLMASYISTLVRIGHESKHAMRLRSPSDLAGASIDPGIRRSRRRRPIFGVKAAANWDAWKPDQGSKAPSLSDVFWPSAGAFAAMGMLGKMDQVLAQKGVSMTIAPLGAVCAVLFATPSTPGARTRSRRGLESLTTSSRLGEKLVEDWVDKSNGKRSFAFRMHQAFSYVILSTCIPLEWFDQNRKVVW